MDSRLECMRGILYHSVNLRLRTSWNANLVSWEDQIKVWSEMRVSRLVDNVCKICVVGLRKVVQSISCNDINHFTRADTVRSNFTLGVAGLESGVRDEYRTGATQI